MSIDRPFVPVTTATRFGRGRRYSLEAAKPPARGIVDDAKLFVLTFAAGFLFVSVYLA